MMKTLDFEENELKSMAIQNVVNKQSCDEMFRNFSDEFTFTAAKMIQSKLFYKQKRMLLAQLQLLISTKAFNPVVYMFALRKRIEVSKELMVTDVEQGNPVRIPACLSQEKLPSSFRFYDPVIRIVKKNMTLHKKEYYALKH